MLVQSLFEHVFTPEVLKTAILFTLSTWIAVKFMRKDELSKYPLINGRRWWEFFSTKQTIQFVQNSKALIEEGLAKSKIFRLVTDQGIYIVLSADYANDLKDNPNLNFGKISDDDCHAHLPGFEPFKQGGSNDEILHDAVRTHMAGALSQLNEPLSDEAGVALQTNWSDNTDWHEINPKSTILSIISQLSSRAFLGEELCRNQDWLRITMSYTIDAFIARNDLNLWPKALRSYVHWFLPSCRKIRGQIAESKAVIEPVLEKRRKAKAARLAEGQPPEKYLDAMQWMEDSAKGRPYDPAISQVMMALAANFSGSDTLTQIIFDLCGQDKLIHDLREEIITVMKDEGWNRSTIYRLKLMDSVLKESQRIKPAAVASMRRWVMKDMQLPDGTPIAKDTKLMVSANQSWDSSIFPDADKFDGYRFLNMREDGDHESTAQFVSTSPSLLGFGHGKQACPGRFFAANELKIALCHVLMKYDIKSVAGSPPKAGINGIYYSADPSVNIAIRRRKEEIFL